jgi:MerR family regulatory protein
MDADRFSIGALARATDTKVETLRYYERAGLLPAPARTGGESGGDKIPHGSGRVGSVAAAV